MDVDRYLERLDCLHLKDAEPTLENLTQLQMRHFRTFPFEDLDMHGEHKKHINLSIEEAYDKMVIRHRGGYCLELNGCFSWLLEKLGYDFYFVESHVYYGLLKKFSKACTHAYLIVTLNNKQYYVDVGTSRFVRVPVELKFDGIQKELLGTYRFIHDLNDSSYIILQRANNALIYDKNTEWFDQVKFRNIPRKFSDFYELNEIVQTIAHPMIYCKTLLGKQLENSSIIIYGRMFSEVIFEENKQTRIDHKDLSDEEIKKLINERFHIQVDDSFKAVDEPYFDV